MDNEAKLMGIKLYRICKLDYLYLLYQVYVLHIEYIGVYGRMEPIKKLFFFFISFSRDWCEQKIHKGIAQKYWYLYQKLVPAL